MRGRRAASCAQCRAIANAPSPAPPPASINFLFAGLFLPSALFPAGWRGLYYAVPTSHILRALTSDQFHCAGTGVGCFVIEVPGAPGAPPTTLTQQAFVQGFTGGTYAGRWGDVGYAALAVAVMLLVAFAAARWVNWARR